MKQFWLYIAFWCGVFWNCPLLRAQNPFNSCNGIAFQTTDSSSIFRDITRISNNTYIAVGEVRMLPISVQDKLTIVNFNICGNTYWRKQIFNPNSGFSDYHVVCVDQNSFVVTCAYTSNLYENPYYNILSMKFDNLGNAIWTKVFSNGVYTDAPTCLTALEDGGVMIGGFSYNFPDNNEFSQAWLIKVDSAGNTEWSKTYGFATASETIRSIVQNEDNTYTIAAQRVQNSTSSLWILKTDSEGNVLWNRILGNGYWTVASKMIPYQDGYLLVGLEQPYIWNVGNAFVLKIDTTGTQQWIKYYGDGGIDEFSNIIKLADDNLIAIGSNQFSLSSLTHFNAWMMKLNAEGDSIWSNTYAYNGTISIDDYVWGLSQTQEGGFLMAGFTSVLNADSSAATQSAWVVRTDSLGNACPPYNGCWAVGTEQTPPFFEGGQGGEQVVVYPNPATHTISIHTQQPWQQLFLYNIHGQEVASYVHVSNNNTIELPQHLQNGMYIARLQLKDGNFKSVKLLISK